MIIMLKKHLREDHYGDYVVYDTQFISAFKAELPN
jgi:hypothetical protein